MTGKRMSRPAIVRFDSLDAMLAAARLSAAFRALTDDEAASRAAADPDAGVIPAGFRVCAGQGEGAIRPLPPRTEPGASP